jgi:hypothetical protein
MGVEDIFEVYPYILSMIVHSNPSTCSVIII